MVLCYKFIPNQNVLFYSEQTKISMWNGIDILLTSNPDLLLNYPKDKVIIKFNTQYNKHISSEYEISSLTEFEEVLKKIETNV